MMREARMTNEIPRSWRELEISKPSEDDHAGALLNLPGGRVIVRSYDTTEAVFARLAVDPAGP